MKNAFVFLLVLLAWLINTQPALCLVDPQNPDRPLKLTGFLSDHIRVTLV